MSTAITSQILIDHASAAHVAARTARSIAAAIDLPAPLPERAAVMASELASNIDKHAWDGAVHVHPLLLGTGLDITALDSGPGMDDVDRCLTDGHTTTGTLGVGLGAVRRMASEFAIASTPAGTLVSARLRAPDDRADSGVRLGHMVLPAEGEEDSGDTIAAALVDHALTLLLVDGLGHGAAAAAAEAEAAIVAEQAFHRDPTTPLPQLMIRLDKALRRTRGAALVLLRASRGGVSFCGVGNISAAVCTGTRTHHLLSSPGVVGLRLDPPVQQDIPVPAGSTIVVHSDGIAGDWLLGPPIQRALSAPLLAAELLRDHRRPYDDASVLVARLPDGRP